MSWHTDFEIRSRDPLPTILVILGFITTVVVGVPLHFKDENLALGMIVLGVGLIFMGIFLWCIDRG